MSEHTPQYGVRVLLELETRAPVVYRVTLFGAEATWRYVAGHGPAGFTLSKAPDSKVGDSKVGDSKVGDSKVGDSKVGEHDESASAEDAPEWALEIASAFLRTLNKNHAGEGDWPRRQLRWRDRRVP